MSRVEDKGRRTPQKRRDQRLTGQKYRMYLLSSTPNGVGHERSKMDCETLGLRRAGHRLRERSQDPVSEPAISTSPAMGERLVEEGEAENCRQKTTAERIGGKSKLSQSANVRRDATRRAGNKALCEKGTQGRAIKNGEVFPNRRGDILGEKQARLSWSANRVLSGMGGGERGWPPFRLLNNEGQIRFTPKPWARAGEKRRGYY